jgi:mono/diheme cytochrome c family protein
LVSLAIPSGAAERHIRPSRVPADKLEEARALVNPLPDSAEIREKGKALYNSKGTCFNCHGTDGDGKGPAAAQLNPSPRNFHHHGLWRHRTEGELFWVIKHGSPGTAMIGFGQVLSDDEIWAVVRYLYSFASERGRGRMGHGRGMGMMGHDGPMMGQHGMMGGMGHGGPKGGTSGCEDNGCGQ